MRPMPELYGNPRKSELRQEITELKAELAAAQGDNRKLRKKLEWARATVTELGIKIQRMETLAKEAASIAAMEIHGRVNERIQADRRAWMESVAAEVLADAPSGNL
jgi:hypothetical protein